jgi:hypothetical protein
MYYKITEFKDSSSTTRKNKTSDLLTNLKALPKSIVDTSSNDEYKKRQKDYIAKRKTT